MTQATYFCAPCALLRIEDGEPVDQVLAGLWPDIDALKRLGHPVCSHHRRMLHSKEMEVLSFVDGVPQWRFNNTPVLEVIGLEQRDIFDQMDLIALVRGDEKTGIDGLLSTLHRWRVLHRVRQHYIAEQETTILQVSQESVDEAAANEEMFRRIAGYLALTAAGLDTAPVAIDDDPDDQISGEEARQFFQRHPIDFDNRFGGEE